ncbi:hypothetical protein CK203_116190 [Vitis vinifera]|uniref:Uncharacterized protein n=1 Tax=Vitis vinifera TaxID=29760 RepID=A0A438FI78_VITVI|nr:hypothetical protein CK203_116190 [Vitis vinifera]
MELTIRDVCTNGKAKMLFKYPILGTNFDGKLQQLDVKNSVLNGELEEEVYKCHPGFDEVRIHERTPGQGLFFKKSEERSVEAFIDAD